MSNPVTKVISEIKTVLQIRKAKSIWMEMPGTY